MDFFAESLNHICAVFGLNIIADVSGYDGFTIETLRVVVSLFYVGTVVVSCSDTSFLALCRIELFQIILLVLL